jgi:hypothetical protein
MSPRPDPATVALRPPNPEVMSKVCPSGCVCQAVRAPGSNVTLPAETRLGSRTGNNASIRTEPVKYPRGPGRDGCEPARVISIIPSLSPPLLFVPHRLRRVTTRQTRRAQ